MWFDKNYRRHLLDMHIDDWDERFLSEFSPKTYVENLKKAKIQGAMIYVQSHVGLTNYPTRVGKMHNAFVGKEDTMKNLFDLCHENGISVVAYYSLVYNTWAQDNHPEWKIVSLADAKKKDEGQPVEGAFRGSRYGLCCPNNPEYREFTKTQIKEFADYAKVDGMFYDMLFWPEMCHCEHCRERYRREVGEEIPTVEDWSDPKWLMHMHKRREWMGEFAQWVTDISKEYMPGVTVEHNVAYSARPENTVANAEEVINACDYIGGDLDLGVFGHSFTCKFYKNITKNQPFEHMFTRCAPGLLIHTQIKSPDVMASAFFLATSHHGATLVIDAIDPVGTMDARVYDQLGQVFGEVEKYQDYYRGEMIEDVGIYYSLKSKFNPRGESYTNYVGATQTLETMVENNVLCGITGGFSDLNKHPLIVASCLTDQDNYDVDRIVKYVEEGGNLYFSGGDCPLLVEKLLGAKVTGRTKETVVYINPGEKVIRHFAHYNEKYPLHVWGTSPVIEGVKADEVVATLSLPYTHRGELRFASIHSDPPGKSTDIPAIVVKNYGKGKVIWSAMPIECNELYDYKHILMNLFGDVFGFDSTLRSDAPDDVEITVFDDKDSLLVNAVLMNTRFKARKVEDIVVSLKTATAPESVVCVPENEPVPFTYEEGRVTFTIKDMKIFKMYEIKF